jgi:putative ABC transport system substrate-binding protein
MRGRALVVAALVALTAVACGDGSNDAERLEGHATIAFLRAVAGAPSTEPAIVAELRAAGFVEGRNLTILAGDPDVAYPDPEDASRAIGKWRVEGVDLIIALSSSGALLAAEEAPDVNILFLSNDPTATGLVEDEDSPEGRLTGASFRVPADRTLSLALRAVPAAKRIGLAYPPGDPAAIASLDAVRTEADHLAIELVTVTFTDASDVTAAVEDLAAGGIDALLLSTSPVATRALAETAAAASAHQLPMIANTTLAQSAVVSLSPDTEELGHQLGRQAARLLGGADPGTVPVEDPSRFVVTLNARVATSLGIELDEELLREADAVIG